MVGYGRLRRCPYEPLAVRVVRYGDDGVTPDRSGVGGLVAGIRADQPVIAEMPEVTEPGDRFGLRFRDEVGTVGLHLHGRAIDQQIDFCRLKPL